MLLLSLVCDHYGLPSLAPPPACSGSLLPHCTRSHIVLKGGRSSDDYVVAAVAASAASGGGGGGDCSRGGGKGGDGPCSTGVGDSASGRSAAADTSALPAAEGRAGDRTTGAPAATSSASGTGEAGLDPEVVRRRGASPP